MSNPMSAEVCIGTKRTKLVRESREGLGPSLVNSNQRAAPIREGTLLVLTRHSSVMQLPQLGA